MWPCLGYHPNSKYKDANPCAPPIWAGNYYSDPAAYQWWTENAQATTPMTADAVHGAMMFPTAVDCAALCKDHPSCDGYRWSDPLHYNGHGTPDSNRWPGDAYQCELFKAADCDTDGSDF